MKIKKAIKLANNFASKIEKEMSMKEMQAMTIILLDIHKMLKEQHKSAKFDLVINEQNPMTLDTFNKMSGAELEINDEIKLKKKEVKSFSYPAIISQVDLNGLYKFDIKIPAFKGYSRNSVSKNDLIEQAHIDLKEMILNAMEWGELREIETVDKSKLKSNEELINIKVKIEI